MDQEISLMKSMRSIKDVDDFLKRKEAMVKTEASSPRPSGDGRRERGGGGGAGQPRTGPAPTNLNIGSQDMDQHIGELSQAEVILRRVRGGREDAMW